VTDAEKLRHLEDRLWKAADQLRANSSLAASQYSIPVLGLIFLRYADVRFTQVETQLAGKATGRRDVGKTDYQAKGVMYVPDTARFSYLQALPKGTDIGRPSIGPWRRSKLRTLTSGVSCRTTTADLDRRSWLNCFGLPNGNLPYLKTYRFGRARWPRRRGRWERLTFLDLPEDVDPSGGRFSKGYETE
jgi:hypothetical protein